MGATAYPQNLSFGAPLVGGGLVSIPKANGNVFYVDGTNGNDTNFGTTPAIGSGAGVGALKTIQKAVDLCDDASASTIYVYPGTYVENVDVGTKSDISIISAQVTGNAKRVAIAPTTGIALTLGAGNRFYAKGIRFVGTSGAGALTQNEGARFDDCDFTSDTTHGIRFKGTVDDSHTGSGTEFNGCLFRECGGAGIHIEIGTNGAVGLYPTNVKVHNSCQFYLNTDDDINDDAAGGALAGFSQWDISDNHFMTVDKTTYLDLNGTAGGTECQVSNNKFSITVNTNYATQFQMPSASVGGFVGNYSSIGVIDGHTF